MRITIFIAVTIILFNFTTANAITDITYFTNTSLNYLSQLPDIIGVRAMGMGNAFIAISDDESIIFSNAAGLCQLKEKRKRWYITYPAFVFIQPMFQKERVKGYVYSGATMGFYFYFLDTYQIASSYDDNTKTYGGGVVMSIPLVKNIYLSARLGHLTKDREVKYPIAPIQENYFQSEDTINEKGTCVSQVFDCLDILYKPSNNFSIGIIYKNNPKIEWKTTGPYHESKYPPYSPTPSPKITGEDILPSLVGIGLVVRFSTNIILALDTIQRKWSEVKRIENSVEINSNFVNTTEIHIGTEYYIYNKVLFRAGLYTKPDYVVNGIDENQTFLTIGTGFKMGRFSIDIGVMESSLLSSGQKKTTKGNIALHYTFAELKSQVK